ncbi:hypothetical protein E4U37_000192 [Claviceps purpurea]|nr:hypothetical protein E4U37_000192 [Claviceps purpurea]
MPKRDYGEPTRRSERLGAQSLERLFKHEEVEEPALSTSRPESSPASPEPVEPAATTDIEPEEPVASIESDHLRGIRSKPTAALPETNMSATDNNNNNDNAAARGAHDNMASITTILQSLVDRLDRMEQAGGRTRSSDREATPDESVFGGKAFRPTGYAALPEFSPYGDDHNAKNPAYDNRARQSQY